MIQTEICCDTDNRCVITISDTDTILFFSTWQQAKAEQEEEFISNTLLKEIHSLKKEKERLAMNYEQEEEYLTNDLSRKLFKVCVGCDIFWKDVK